VNETILRAHIWLVATLVPLLVKLLKLKNVLKILTPPPHFRPYRGTSPHLILTIVRRRLAHPRNMRRRACLREGLTLFHFLRLAGIPARLHFGVYDPGVDQRRLHAHCWVTVEGKPLSLPPGDPTALVLTHSG